MKKFFRIAGYFLAGIALLIIAGLVYFNSKYPDVSKPNFVKVEITAERLRRGEYLANHVAGCMACHSLRDWTKLAAPMKSGTEGEGGEKFGKEVGVPGTLYAKNITPSAIGNWTDGELIRAITQGVNKDNKTLFPLMPYPLFNHISKEDLYSIVAYLRSLKPIENKVTDSELDFPLNFIVKTMPLKDYTPAPEPNKNDPINYGKYLTTLAGCTDCHTPSEKGEPKPGMDFAGGQEFNLPQGTVRSENITPDKETGIGRWTKNEFIERFKSFDSDFAKNVSVDPHGFNTVMPFTFYAGMTEEDLGAIYDYLRTIKPVHNPITIFTPAKK